jgi:hypothetical protein
MLVALAAAAAGIEFAFDEDTFFFGPQHVRAGEPVQASFPRVGPQWAFFWRPLSPERPPALAISVIAPSGANYTQVLHLESGIRASGLHATLRFSEDVLLQLWVLPRVLCPGALAFYSAPLGFTDNLRPSRRSGVCAFFSHTDTRVTVSGVAGAEFFRAADLMSPGLRCETADNCTFESKGHSFLSVNPISRSSHLTLAVAGRGPAEQEPCRRTFIPIVSEGRLVPCDMKLDPPNLMSCDAALELSLAALVTFALVFIALVALALFGWGAKIWHRVRIFTSGAKDINHDIDAKQLLCEDQIEQLNSIVPGAEEEDGGDA